MSCGAPRLSNTCTEPGHLVRVVSGDYEIRNGSHAGGVREDSVNGVLVSQISAPAPAGSLAA